MIKTLKIRKGPDSSASKYSVGTKKKGNDGNMWKIIENKNGTKRWLKITNKHSTNTKKKSNKDSTKKLSDISLNLLKQLKKKYNVTTNGSKKEIAYGLWKVRGRAMSDKDLKLISQLLPRKEQKKIEKKIKESMDNPIINYKGLWKPLPKSLSKMSRQELLHNLRSFRNAWEKITTRNQDLDDERLESETIEGLRKLLKFYYSESAKLLAEDWLRK